MTTETSIYEYAKQGLALSSDKPAIWFYGKSITYRELFEKIDNVADHLYALGVREGTVVTIHLPNCPQAVMAIYAVAKLGGICNMVHALTPEAALRENMVFTESKFLLTYMPECEKVAEKTVSVDVSAHMGWFYKMGYRLTSKRPRCSLFFTDFEKPFENAAQIPEPVSLSEKPVAYFSSSGTTGEPKTVIHCHRAINNWVANAQDFFHKDNLCGESLLAVLPLFHGSGFGMDMHQLIVGGGTLVQMAKWDSKLAAKLIRKYSITYLTGVPKVYQTLLGEPGFDGSSLAQCYVSGDNVGAELKRAFNERVGKPSCLFEGYGMTETVTACFSNGAYHEKIESSGYPLRECEIAVMQDEKLVPHGEGELILRTNTMMLGYLRDAETTRAVLSESGWLKTGDYGRIDEDGYVYFIDRIKNTIVHNGYVIFPSELERLTMSVGGVADVCVVGIVDPKTKTQNVRAYIVTAEDEETMRGKLMQAWREHLPKYSIPQEIRFVDELPRNKMAKVDRKALEKIP